MPDPGASLVMVRAANGKTQTMIRTLTLLIVAISAASGTVRAQTPLCGMGLYPVLHRIGQRDIHRGHG
jgi:hypothetical protein